MAQTGKRLPAMRETWVRFLGQEDPLRSGEDQEKEMAIHSSTLAWKIPWTEEPDSLQSMGSQHTTERLHFHFKGHLADVNKSCINNQVFGPWVRKIPWGRKWHPRLYSCLENPTDRGAWRAAVHGVVKSQAGLSN